MDTKPTADEVRPVVERLFSGAKGKPQKGDVELMEGFFERAPELWRRFNLAKQAAERAIDQTEASPGARIAMKANYEGQLRTLGYGQAPPLERILIEHAALCWLRLQVIEQKYSGVTAESITLTLADFWERRLSSAQRRYLRACETLARVRRLRLPALQVNIGENQVNVAGPVGGAGGMDERKVIDP